MDLTNLPAPEGRRFAAKGALAACIERFIIVPTGDSAKHLALLRQLVAICNSGANAYPTLLKATEQNWSLEVTDAALLKLPQPIPPNPPVLKPAIRLAVSNS